MEKNNMKRVIITGPTGAIGIALIQQLIAERVEVIAVCNPASTRLPRIPKSSLVRIVKCDLENLKELSTMELPPCDIFYHLGWAGTIGSGRNDSELQEKNIRFTLDAVDAAYQLGCKRFVGAGSQAEYGRVEGILTPDTPVHPENGYGIAKYCAGMMSRLKCQQLEMEHIWIRVLSIYGPYDGPNTMVMSTIRKFLAEEAAETTKGEQLWDYLFSKDAGKAFYLAGIKGKNGAVYCLGSGKKHPLHEYITEIQKATAPDAEIHFGAVPYAKNQVMHLCADITPLQNDTGFEPETSFEEGIRQTVVWYKKEQLGERK